MTESERIDFLVNTLEGGKGISFCRKTGIRQNTLTYLRQGKRNIGRYVQKISSAYPSVRPEWLTTGDGEPFFDTIEKGVILQKIEGLENEVRRLADLVERLIKYQQSANGK